MGVHVSARLQRPRHAYRPPPAATTASHDRPGSASARSAAWRRAPASPRTRLWSTRTARRQRHSADLVAAIDQAVADGVDVINYSISGTRRTSRTPTRSRSSSPPTPACSSRPRGQQRTDGLDGRTPVAVDDTVAAGTHTATDAARSRSATARRTRGVGDGRSAGAADRLDGRGMAGAAANGHAGSANPKAARPGEVAGKIVLCDRGVIAARRQEPRGQQAGGVGMVCLYTSPTTRSTPTSTSRRFTVHENVRRQQSAIKAYAATRARRRDQRVDVRLQRPAPFTASFSSRGPLKASGGDLLSRTSSLRVRTSWPRSRLRATRPRSTSERHVDVGRTSPAWRRCSRTSTPTGRRWRSSRR